jgi:translation initiation factor IF-2
MSNSTNTNTSKSRRAPIVAIVGHVDHGKSSLLDYIRKTNVVDSEAGGITQHISAYEVNWKTTDGIESKLTFLDTPGHAAFSNMREKSVEIADIAILVVSAEDGAKPQTKESWKVLQKKNIPTIVAINKIDKPGANIEMVKNSLSDIGLYVEGWGGNIPFIPISAKIGTGVDELLDLIVLQSDIMDLDYNPKNTASGIILESFVDSKRGIAATLIIKDGTLSSGTNIWSGKSVAPTRIMENFLGKAVKSAYAGQAIKVTGFDMVPTTGAEWIAYDKKRDAEEAQHNFKNDNIVEKEMFESEETDFVLPVIIKADVYGSLDAVEKEILNIKREGVKIKIIRKEVGLVQEKDVLDANIDKKICIIAFHTSIDKKGIETARRCDIKIHSFDIIYKLSEWLVEYIEKAKPKTEIEEIAGTLKVIRVFNRSKESQVVGGRVDSGEIKYKGIVNIMRKDISIGKGKIVELQSQKQKVDTVQEGSECGLMIDSRFDIAEGDRLQMITKKFI